jgi:AP endonuclease-2
MGKNVILTGDLNVSRDLIDTAKAEDNMRAEGMTHDQYLSTPNRRVFNQLLMNGQVPSERDEGREEPVLYDLCREFHPDREGMYTHWEQKINARPGNFGSRIDFILCSIAIKDWFQEANIQEGLMGSDHCPVYAVTKDKVLRQGTEGTDAKGSETQMEAHILDLMNPQGMFKDGVRQREYNATKDVPALSGKLIPEFTKRRNIRDMFSKKPTLTKSPSAVPTATESNGMASVLETAPLSLADVNSTASSTATENTTAPVPSPMNSPEKRRAPSASPVKPVKRSKSSTSAANNGAPSLAKGQKSLKGFFQSHPKPKAQDTVEVAAPSPSSAPTSNGTTNSLMTPLQSAADPDLAPSPTTYEQTDPLASQEASKEGWTKLFSKKPSPRCEGHAEPCIILTTKKPGVNCGRQFYMCPRPIGPSGQKETGTQWRCGTFIWASDWKGS